MRSFLKQVGDLSKEVVDKRFAEFQEQPEMISKLDEIFEIYKSFQEIFSKSFKEYADSEYSEIRDLSDKKIKTNQGIAFVKQLFKQLDESGETNIIKNISLELSKSGLKNFTLNDIIDVNLYDYLIKNNIIGVEHLTEDEKRTTAEILSTYDQLPISELNSDMILKIINSVNQNDTIVNKVIINPDKISGNINLQLEALLTFIENEPKIDNELFTLIHDNIKHEYLNKTNSLKSVSLDLQDHYTELMKEANFIKEDLLNPESPNSLEYIELVLNSPVVDDATKQEYEKTKIETIAKLKQIEKVVSSNLDFSKMVDELNNSGINYKDVFLQKLKEIEEFIKLAENSELSKRSWRSISFITN